MNATKPNYRAWYKADFESRDGPLRFSLHDEDCGLFFVMDIDPVIKYEFYIPFMDKEGWIVEQSIGSIDCDGNEIFENDIVEIHDDCKKIIGNIHQNPEMIYLLTNAQHLIPYKK